VAKLDPGVRYSGRVQNAFFCPSRKLRFNHPVFSKATVVTITDDNNNNNNNRRKRNHTQPLSANERNQI
jgi:hypothetical protein